TECRSSSTGWQMPVTTSVLLIGSSHAVGTAVQEALAEIGPGAFALEGAARFSEAIERLSKAGIDAILSHLTLPDCQGMETLDRLLRAAPQLPILILAGGE